MKLFRLTFTLIHRMLVVLLSAFSVVALLAALVYLVCGDLETASTLGKMAFFPLVYVIIYAVGPPRDW